MSHSVDQEDNKLLLAKIQQNAFSFVKPNKRIEEFQEELQTKFILSAQDHQRQLNLRLKLFEQLQLLNGATESSDSVQQFNIDDDVIYGNTGFYELDGQSQKAEATTSDRDLYLTELGKLMGKHYERMNGIANAHGQLLCKEQELLLQLQTANSDKNSLLTRLHRKLDELENDHRQQLHQVHENLQHILTERNEKDYQLIEANNKLAESDAKNNELSTELARCMQQLQKDGEEQNNSLVQLKMQLDEANNELTEWRAKNHELTEKLRESETKLQNSRELASMTKLRQLQDLEMTEALSAMMFRLQEEQKATNIKEQDNVTRRRDSKDENVTGEPKPLDTRDSNSSDHLQRLRENHQLLTELLEAKKVAASMFEDDALSIRELQSIQQRSTPSEAADALLEIVLELGNKVQLYECFMTGLQKTNQQHIWSWLSYKEFDINCEHVRLIQSQYSFLVETIEHSGLITLLFSRGIIDVRDKDDLEAESSCIKRNEKMLSMLGRKSQTNFDLFLKCLIETGQRHVANKLRGNFDTTDAGSEKTEHQPFSVVPSILQKSMHRPSTTTFTAGTSLSHVISSEGRGTVVGVTVFDEKLFVLRGESKERLEQYEIKSFDELEAIRVNGLCDGWLAYRSLTSCCINNCLFVNDVHTLFRVDVSSKKIISWKVNGGRNDIFSLSVNKTGNVLVTCFGSNTFYEYSTVGSLYKSIKLPRDHVTNPLHIVQFTKGRYVVSHLGPEEGVSLIDQHGTLITSYRNSKTIRLVDFPRWMVVVNDCILVTDAKNNRILSLNSSLNNARELSLPVDSRLSEPCRTISTSQVVVCLLESGWVNIVF